MPRLRAAHVLRLRGYRPLYAHSVFVGGFFGGTHSSFPAPYTPFPLFPLRPLHYANFVRTLTLS
jgi:hypothetical protein